MLLRLLGTWVFVVGGFGILLSGRTYGLVLGLLGLVMLVGLIRDFRRGLAAVEASRESAPAASAVE
jgi:hypothetical protein